MGEVDNDIPAPLFGYVTSVKNSRRAATQTIGTTEAGIREWTGLEATGTISYGKSGQPQPATLSIATNGAERLDVTFPDGVRSLRILGFTGKLRDPQGGLKQLPMRNAVVSFLPLGIFAPKSPLPNTTSGELEQTNIEGQSYQRMRYEYRPRELPDPTKRGLPAFATELYTSSSTGVIYKSVDYVHSLEASAEPYIRVITYKDYKTFGSSAFPTEITESLDGQIVFVLRLTEIQVGSTRPLSDFVF